jgi:MFS superfamily sulfate permease-like transporter
MKSSTKSIADKVSRLDLVLGVVAGLVAIGFVIFSSLNNNPQLFAYAQYAGLAAMISFLAAWAKPANLFSRALERKMIRKRAPRNP